MTNIKETAQGASEAVGEVVDNGQKTKEELKKMKFSAIGQELKMLQEDLKETDAKERRKKIWDRVKGIAVIAFFGRWMKQKDIEQMEADEKDVHVTNEKEAEKPEREEMVRILLSGKEMTDATESEEELSMTDGNEYYGEPGRKEWLVNMANGARKYYTNNGKLLKKHQLKLDSGKITADEIPDKYLFTGTEIFRNMPASFEEFKERLLEKWFPHAKDKEKAITRVTDILQNCALGRFQVLPKFHFKKMGWKSKGEQGLRDMFDYLNSPKKQFQLFEKNLKNQIRKFSTSKYDGFDIPVLTAIDYYGGNSKVKKYMLDINNPALAKREYKNHGSVISYRDAVMKQFRHWRSEGFSEYESIAIAIEKIESEGSYAKRMFLARKKRKSAVLTTS